jgi:hypothetical protein
VAQASRYGSVGLAGSRRVDLPSANKRVSERFTGKGNISQLKSELYSSYLFMSLYENEIAEEKIKLLLIS